MKPDGLLVLFHFYTCFIYSLHLKINLGLDYLFLYLFVDIWLKVLNAMWLPLASAVCVVIEKVSIVYIEQAGVAGVEAIVR